MNPEQAEQALIAWASVERDEVVRAAYDAGVSKNRIHTITGIARTTIDRILEVSMPQTQTDSLIDYLTRFVEGWPRQWSDGYHSFTLAPSMASAHTGKDIMDVLLADAEFTALKLGTFLNTPDGELLAGAVERLAPPLYREDIELLVEALQLAAKAQHDAAVNTFIRGVVVAFGLGALAAAVARGKGVPSA